MADDRVADLVDSGEPANDDLLYLVDVSAGPPRDRQLTVSNLRKALDIKGGGSTHIKTTIINNITNVTVDENPLEIVDEDGNRITIPDDSAMAFEALFVARRTNANNESAGYKISGVIDRNAGTVALVGPTTKFTYAEDSDWNVVAQADDVNKALVFIVTGQAAKTIQWSGIVTTVTVTG